MKSPISSHLQAELNVNSGNLNKLRAAVLGANDGIVSVSAVVVGVAGAEDSIRLILTAGIATLIAGALSMAVGEYVSVSSQRDTEKAMLEKERLEIENNPEEELEELSMLYEKKGLTNTTARIVAKELSAHDTLAAHADVELGIDPNNLTNPLSASIASGLAFLSGGSIPIFATIFSPKLMRVSITFISVFCVLFVIGILSAKAGGASKKTATVRVVLGGLLAMLITFGIGKLFGVTGI